MTVIFFFFPPSRLFCRPALGWKLQTFESLFMFPSFKFAALSLCGDLKATAPSSLKYLSVERSKEQQFGSTQREVVVVGGIISGVQSAALAIKETPSAAEWGARETQSREIIRWQRSTNTSIKWKGYRVDGAARNKLKETGRDLLI